MFPWRHCLSRARDSSILRLHDHTQTNHTRQDSSGRVISASQRPVPDKNNNQKRQTSVLPAGFEPTVPASEQLQTHALDRAATGIGYDNHTKYKYNMWANFRDLCGKIKWITYYFLSLTMKGDKVTTTPGYLIQIISFIFSKDMDNLWNY
jgi:hypothetical protein